MQAKQSPDWPRGSFTAMHGVSSWKGKFSSSTVNVEKVKWACAVPQVNMWWLTEIELQCRFLYKQAGWRYNAQKCLTHNSKKAFSDGMCGFDFLLCASFNLNAFLPPTTCARMKLKPVFDLRLTQGHSVPLKMVQTKYKRGHILFTLLGILEWFIYPRKRL